MFLSLSVTFFTVFEPVITMFSGLVVNSSKSHCTMQSFPLDFTTLLSNDISLGDDILDAEGVTSLLKARN